MRIKTINFRLAVICLAAASVGLSIAIISIAKLLLLLCAVATLLLRKGLSRDGVALAQTFTLPAVLAVLLAFVLSLFWTVAPLQEAAGSLAKYGKLLLILAMMALIRDRREALYALAAFAVTQLLVVISSWMLFADMPVAWASSRTTVSHYTVFSGYLDQGIMSAVFAALCWHLRGLVPGRFGPRIAAAAAVLSLANVFFVMVGRSGQLVGVALLSLAIMWQLPGRYRMIVAALPFLLVTVLFFSSPMMRDRLTQLKTEVQGYSAKHDASTSSGIRLAFWRRAAQVIAQRPLAGAGVGSWSSEYDRLERLDNPRHEDINRGSNPHQEYLLWGVQLGIPGLLLIAGFMLSVLRDTLKMETPYARAAQSALLALAVACLFNSTLYDGLIGDFFCVLIGLLLALGLSKPDSLPPTQHTT
ncbi:O-antigen ligase [Polaromonas sp. JS666]|uniref:O-antigen ligase family protein n=1 Tax=Polaromonas sp. (strain JS666 / ATCC BAA-500) TaxID=296591 RepID=UPI0020C919F8|nr:O-antigen ligase family protein [Polaromonas sp. JS666]